MHWIFLTYNKHMSSKLLHIYSGSSTIQFTACQIFSPQQLLPLSFLRLSLTFMCQYVKHRYFVYMYNVRSIAQHFTFCYYVTPFHIWNLNFLFHSENFFCLFIIFFARTSALPLFSPCATFLAKLYMYLHTYKLYTS